MLKNVIAYSILKRVTTAGLGALTLGAVMTTASEPAQAYWRGYGPGGFYRHGGFGFGYRPYGYRFGYRPYGYGFRHYGFGYRPYAFAYGYRPYRFGYVY